jgi:hypothetical protein
MAKPLITHLVTFKPTDPSEKLRDSIGGYPYLPEGLDQPVCSCGERMSLYFQFDIRAEFGRRDSPVPLRSWYCDHRAYGHTRQWLPIGTHDPAPGFHPPRAG